MVRGQVLARVGAVGVAVALQHTALHVGRLVFGQGRFAPTDVLKKRY